MIKRGIFKANDIRGITEGSDPEWDAAGSYAIGAALVEVLNSTRTPERSWWVATCGPAAHGWQLPSSMAC